VIRVKKPLRIHENIFSTEELSRIEQFLNANSDSFRVYSESCCILVCAVGANIEKESEL